MWGLCLSRDNGHPAHSRAMSTSYHQPVPSHAWVLDSSVIILFTFFGFYIWILHFTFYIYVYSRATLMHESAVILLFTCFTFKFKFTFTFTFTFTVVLCPPHITSLCPLMHESSLILLFTFFGVINQDCKGLFYNHHRSFCTSLSLWF